MLYLSSGHHPRRSTKLGVVRCLIGTSATSARAAIWERRCRIALMLIYFGMECEYIGEFRQNQCARLAKEQEWNNEK